MDQRTLSDADVAAIAEALEDRLANNLYSNLGKGVWALFQKAVILIVLGIAAYGAFRGH